MCNCEETTHPGIRCSAEGCHCHPNEEQEGGMPIGEDEELVEVVPGLQLVQPIEERDPRDEVFDQEADQEPVQLVVAEETSLEAGKSEMDKQLEEIDRNARAYGFEIGRGHPLTTDLHEISPDNPFMNKNWREQTEDGPERLFEGQVPVILSATGAVVGSVIGFDHGDRKVMILTMSGSAGDSLQKVMESTVPIGLNWTLVPKGQLPIKERTERPGSKGRKPKKRRRR